MVRVNVTATSVPAGGTVEVAVSDLPNPTARDWIGFYRQGEPDDHAYVNAGTNNGAWFYLWSCSKQPQAAPKPPPASKTCSFFIPNSVPPGTYEFRLFPNNEYAPRLATSPRCRCMAPALGAAALPAAGRPAAFGPALTISGSTSPA